MIGIQSSINMGPWCIPHMVQTILIEKVVERFGSSLTYMITEFSLVDDLLAVKQDLIENPSHLPLVFSSIFQLPKDEVLRSELLKLIGDREVIFSIEKIEGRACMVQEEVNLLIKQYFKSPRQSRDELLTYVKGEI